MKLTPRLLLSALAMGIVLPAGAFAAKGDRKKPEPAPAFATVDKDGDESISESEYVAANEKLGDAAKTRFAALDKNHDGKLSKDEFAAAATGKKKPRKKKNN